MRRSAFFTVLAAATVAAGGSVTTSAASAADGPTPPPCPTALGTPSQAVNVAATVASGGAATITAQPATTQQGSLRYHFAFGDGSTADQTSPTVVHHYGYNGSLGLQVTVSGAGDASMTSATCMVFVDGVKNSVHRYAGDDRYLTSAAVSQWVWADASGDTTQRRQAKSVVLASGAGFADALAGVPLAEYRQGPLLLSEPATLTKTTENEIKRILPRGSTVYLLGGTSALAPAVESQLVLDGYTVTRYGGADRYKTAMQIATKGLDNPASVIVATGTGFADALAAGPVATSDDFTVDGKPAAIILSDGIVFPDAETAQYVRSRFVPSSSLTSPEPKGVMAIGGPAYCAVTYAAAPISGKCDAKGMSLLGDHGLNIANDYHGHFYFAVIGGNRYRTAAEVAYYTHHNVSADPALNTPFSDRFGLASGTDFPDALTGGAAMATLHSPILLTARDYFPDGTADALSHGFKPTSGPTYEADIFGGPAAIAPELEQQLHGIYG
ncbi:cell wall-binding repeat-containing protein [Catenulispora subtropica]|uniref:cell wall-binding repeat-containing protein n=1 Tax=Catenulispora subtropica TaxID=450798 RepID=UPI0031DFF25A